MSKSWRVCVPINADQAKVHKTLVKYGFYSPFKPTRTTRLENRNGLLCHCDEELCFVCTGPNEIPDGILEEPLINAILESPRVTLA